MGRRCSRHPGPPPQPFIERRRGNVGNLVRAGLFAGAIAALPCLTPACGPFYSDAHHGHQSYVKISLEEFCYSLYYPGDTLGKRAARASGRNLRQRGKGLAQLRG